MEALIEMPHQELSTLEAPQSTVIFRNDHCPSLSNPHSVSMPEETQEMMIFLAGGPACSPHTTVRKANHHILRGLVSSQWVRRLLGAKRPGRSQTEGALELSLEGIVDFTQAT